MNRDLLDAIYLRAKELRIVHPQDCKTDVLMDLISADKCFNMRLDDWLDADDFNFSHDFIGISNNINRNEYPSVDFGFFVPRFAG